MASTQRSWSVAMDKLLFLFLFIGGCLNASSWFDTRALCLILYLPQSAEFYFGRLPDANRETGNRFGIYQAEDRGRSLVRLSTPRWHCAAPPSTFPFSAISPGSWGLPFAATNYCALCLGGWLPF